MWESWLNRAHRVRGGRVDCHAFRIYREPRGRRGLALAIGALLFFCVLPAWADSHYPIFAQNPSSLRQSIVGAAESFLGVKYVYGGENRSGMDCSGLVFASYLKAAGKKVPRTVKELAAWVVPISASELQPGDLVFFSLSANVTNAIDEPVSSVDLRAAQAKAEHVALYSGGGIFIHSASVGDKTGVVFSSLSERYWDKRYLFAGRAVSPRAFSGYYADFSLGAVIDPHSGGVDWIPVSFRGLGAGAGIAVPIGSAARPLFEIGARLDISYDSLLGDFRLPIELVLSTPSGLSIFFGPAFTFGSASLPASAASSGTALNYEPVNAWIASAGFRWSSFISRDGPAGAGPYFEIRYDRYLPAAGQTVNQLDTMRASLSFGLGFRFRNFF